MKAEKCATTEIGIPLDEITIVSEMTHENIETMMVETRTRKIGMRDKMAEIRDEMRDERGPGVMEGAMRVVMMIDEGGVMMIDEGMVKDSSATAGDPTGIDNVR